MPAFLPPNLLALFAPRPPLEFLTPVDKLPWDKDREKKGKYDGMAECMDRFEKAEDQPLPIREETQVERKERIRKLKIETHKRQMQEDLLEWKPNDNKNATLDGYKTLFVANLSYETTEKTLKKEFEQYGHISEVIIVKDKLTGKSRGYAFIEFESERGMKSAYKYWESVRENGTFLISSFLKNFFS